MEGKRRCEPLARTPLPIAPVAPIHQIEPSTDLFLRDVLSARLGGTAEKEQDVILFLELICGCLSGAVMVL